ncbi:MAG: DNA replication/repair protein RecF [Lachnospiraceae bacterium]|nr:DNA replication/repair protein RecF [Lachnospiraceae bacterium]
MFIESLELNNYRNYKDLKLSFDEKTNLLYGDNAQGKTNILESIYVCATTKSHRGSKDKELINFEKDESHIRVKYIKNNLPYVIDMHLKKNHSKGIAVNGVVIKKASELFGKINVVCFSPEDLNIIKEGPAERRKFVDMELCQLNSLYVSSLINYNKVIIQKNRVLKESYYNSEINEILDVYDEQLKKYGKEVFFYREKFIEEINPIINRIHSNISDGKESLKLVYEKCEIRDLRKEELKAKTTLSGPHRDDIAFILNDIDLRKYGSQGQQRTAALSLKLAEIELVKNKIDDYPVLLLDDVLSELDTGRQNKLLNVIDNIQTIITCTGVKDFISNNFNIAKTMYVKNANVTLVEAM